MNDVLPLHFVKIILCVWLFFADACRKQKELDNMEGKFLWHDDIAIRFIK